VTHLFDMIEAVDDEKLAKRLKPIRSHLDAIFVPFEQVESVHRDLLELMPEQIVDALVLAWHHEHLSYQCHGQKKHAHQQQSQQWLDFSEGLLDDQFEQYKVWVFEKLDAVVKASSLVEMVNSLLRPYLHSCKGQITQETLNLIMFYHNHRRYKGGRRQGKAPIELLTGEILQGDWVDLFIQHKQEALAEACGAASPVLKLVPSHHGQTPRPQMSPDQAIWEPSADRGQQWQPIDIEAA
jgi:hypothetical protein